MNPQNKAIIIVYLAVFLFFAALAAFFIDRNYEQKKEAYHARLNGELRIAYDVITASHAESARIIFNSLINQPEILEICKQANATDEDARNAARQQLLKKLGPHHERIKLRDIRHLHFILPNGESFLRVPWPEKYGDSLKGVRYSVDKVNAERIAVSGFEEGPLFSEFRHVFPLIHNGRYLGCVEINMGFDAIRRRMEWLFPHWYAFIIQRRLVEEKGFTDPLRNYRPSDLSDDYLCERDYVPGDTLDDINAALRPAIQKRLQTGEGFVVEAGAARLAVFLPVKNIQGQQAAYIVSYNDDATLSRHRSEYIITLVIATGAVFIIVLLFYLLAKSRRSLRAEKEKLQQEQGMFVSGAVVVFKWQNRENWPVDYVSANVGELVGFTAADFSGGKVPYAGIVHPEDQKRVADERAAFSQNHSERFEHQPYRLIHQNGNSVWVMDYTTILRDKTGNITHYLGYLVDITGLKKAQEALRESEERLDLALKGADLGIWDWHIPSGKVVFNERWAQMLGYTPDDIEPNVGSWEKLLHPDDIEPATSALNEHLEGRTPIYQTEHRLRAKSGEWKWILDTGRVFERDGQGNPVRMAGTRQDITGRKRAEELLRASNDRLEKALSELKETQGKMVRQERLAAVGQLAAGIAHDFNNILTGISGFAELLQVSPKTPESMQPSLQKIIASTRRAAHLVSQLLDFSGKGIHRAQRVELDALLRESVGLLERSFPGSIKITLNVAPGNYLITADPAQLQQVVTNLALNAGDAMPSGGNMEIGLSRVEMAGEETCPLCGRSLQGEWVCLSVADTDGGIPADLLPRIFEPFFTTKEIGQRTGLGLSQVLGIVCLHNGHIAVHSRVGRGATFAVYLPPASEQDGRQTEETRPAITPGQGQTVLLVEDDPAVAETIQAMLEHRGYRVITAVNGREALAACREHPAETTLVLSDMVMPDMGGGALFRALRAEDPGIKVIMMSDYPLGEEGAKLLEQGVSAWLEKPVSFGRLSQAMDRALSNRKGRWG